MDYDLERPEHAYLLGFLQGDGHLYAGRGQKGRLSVELQERDAELLERLLPLLPGSRMSTRSRTTNFSSGEHRTAVLSCARLEVRDALRRAGMVEGPKSLCVAPPQGPYSLRDFARGFCDADGSLGLTGKGQPYLSFVTRSPAMADWWCEQVVPHSGLRRSWTPNKRDGVANIMVANEGAQALARWLYQEQDLALARKAAAAASIQLWARPVEMRRAYTAKRWTQQEDKLLLEGGRSQKQLAELLGRTVQSVNLRQWRLRAAQGADRGDP